MDGNSRNCTFFRVGLCLILFPEIRFNFPRLNTIVDNGLSNLALQLGVISILVYPLPRQERILTSHYGYVPTTILFYPSPYILGGSKNPIDMPPKVRLIKNF